MRQIFSSTSFGVSATRKVNRVPCMCHACAIQVPYKYTVSHTFCVIDAPEEVVGKFCFIQSIDMIPTVYTCEYNTNKHPSKVSASKTRLYGTCMAQSGCAMHVPCMCHAVPYNVPCMCHTYRQHTFFTGGPIQCILINTIFTYIHRRDHIYRLYETDFFRHSI